MSNYSKLNIHIHELNILLELLFRAGEDGQFPLTHNQVLDLLSMLQTKALEAGTIIEGLNDNESI